MKAPKLRKSKKIYSYHGYNIIDNYSWVHQNNILDVLTNPNLLDKEVKSYLQEENKFAARFFSSEKKTKTKLFNEIKGRIKLADQSVPYKDANYTYWTKTTKKGNYSIKLRKKNNSNQNEVIWNGDKEKKKFNSSYFGIGTINVSYNDKYLAYSLDLKGSEYYDIRLRDINKNQDSKEVIKDTTGSILFSYDSKYFFYSKLDTNHRPKEIYLHKIGTSQNKDILIYKENFQRFSVSIETTSDKKFYIINSGDHSTNKCYLLNVNLKIIKTSLFYDYKENITYSLDSWNNNFYIHTNYNAKDFKISISPHAKKNLSKDFIKPKKDTIIGSFLILENWFLWKETKNANSKIFVLDKKSERIEEINFFDEKIKSVSFSTYEKNKKTNLIYISFSSPKNPSKIFLYNIKNKKKKIVKKQLIPSGFNENDYVVERIYAESKDKKKIPITIIRHVNTKLNGSSKLLLYGYGSYGSSVGNSFSSAKFSLINRGIIWANAHIRGGMECGMSWWKNGKMLKKKNTFNDYISCAEHLIKKQYTSSKKIIGMGGSTGGLLMGAVLNQKPKIFLAAILAVPFVDSLTTNLNHSLPLTVGEFKEFGNAKKYKKHFEYIKSYAPYNNIKRQNYPHIFVTTSLFDNRVLFDEPLKYVAKLRDFKKDKNVLLLKTEMEGGHGGKTGRDSSIDEITFDYSFILKISKIKF